MDNPTYFLIYRYDNKKSSDIVIARSYQKGRAEIEAKLKYFRDECVFNKPKDKLIIKKV